MFKVFFGDWFCYSLLTLQDLPVKCSSLGDGVFCLTSCNFEGDELKMPWRYQLQITITFLAIKCASDSLSSMGQTWRFVYELCIWTWTAPDGLETASLWSKQNRFKHEPETKDRTQWKSNPSKSLFLMEMRQICDLVFTWICLSHWFLSPKINQKRWIVENFGGGTSILRPNSSLEKHSHTPGGRFQIGPSSGIRNCHHSKCIMSFNGIINGDKQIVSSVFVRSWAQRLPVIRQHAWRVYPPRFHTWRFQQHHSVAIRLQRTASKGRLRVEQISEITVDRMQRGEVTPWMRRLPCPLLEILGARRGVRLQAKIAAGLLALGSA